MSLPFKSFLIRWLPFLPHLKKVDWVWANLVHVIRRDAFYCSALSGESDYNICINSDMTVSCNCGDIDGSGHIGDLRIHTLEEIFRGRTAAKFRNRLSRGMLPIKRCMSCRELKKVPRAEAKSHLSNFTPPRIGIMVENTVRCNLQCVNCGRKAILKTRKQHRMSLQDMEIVAKNIRSNAIGVVHFFNLGEPFLSDTIREEIAILKEHNPDTRISISTNGILINREDKFEAALMADYLFISLDGATNESVNKYQVGGNFDVTYRNMRELVRLRNARNRMLPVIEWKYVVFSWNDSEAEIERAVELARQAQVDILSLWPGVGSPAQVSTRFKNDEYFQRLGSASWKGRELDFRK